LARAIEKFVQAPVPSTPKTTFNIGVIRGGTSVNSIPESASMRVDVRSTSTPEIERLERALRVALDTAIETESEQAQSRPKSSRRAFGLSAEVVVIGDRPGGELPPGARILNVVRAVDAHLGNVAQVQRASTDANIPLSLGRELGLKRILLTLLALAGVSE
jgi:di/tripeptidase